MSVAWTAGLVAEALITRYFDQATTANLFEFQLPADELRERQSDDPYRWARRTDLLTIVTGGLQRARQWPLDHITCETEQRNKFGRSGFDWRPPYVPAGWRIAFEIKISRADLVGDLRDEGKHSPIRRCVNEMYFVLPDTILTQTETVKWGEWAGAGSRGTGLVEVYRDPRPQWLGKLRARIARAAPLRLQAETPPAFVDQLVRRSLYGSVSSGLSSLKRRNQWGAISQEHDRRLIDEFREELSAKGGDQV